MINEKLNLNSDLFDREKLEQKATRDGFGLGLMAAGENNENVVALCADLAESTRAHWFQEKFPDRYIEMGVAEQNLATVASGLANSGKIPFMMSYAAFSPGRNWEQIRSTVCLNNVPVKVVGSHAGISVGPDGATHQALEDIATMRVLPNMTVIVPCDSEEARKATIAMAEYPHPVYIRLSRAKFPVFTTPDSPFEIGKSRVVYSAPNAKIGIITCGTLVYEAMMAAHELGEVGVAVSVLHLGTIKPIDQQGILDFVANLDHVVTAEEHQIHGGVGAAVAEVLVQHNPKKMSFIGMHDEYGQSGEPYELLAHYGLDQAGIVKHIQELE